MIYSRIIATGGYLPARVMDNSELESMIDTSDEWIQERTGIKKRHIAAPDETTCDMAEQAALKALAVAEIDANTIDQIIVATTTPDWIFPSTACLLQERLGIDNNCAAYDVQAVCTGFIYALSIADLYIKSGAHKRIMVVGADVNSRIIDWNDRGTCVIFADGAGAIILEASAEPGIFSTHLHANGKYTNLLNVPAGVSKPGDYPYMKMKGNEVFKYAVKTLGDIVDETLAANNLTKSDIDWLVPHQANIRIIAATAKKLDLPMERVVLTIADHGNTSGGSIPLALDTAITSGDIKPGEILLLEAFGAGFTWGSALIRY
ncbi:MAG: 3-oxoacyl-ACP synthase [Gammaproteobacteria bacterium RIFCSPLOWO2_02_FULL_52_10]|nr:MAG: 3-oxoacyl-ACP synthase [Gammaproteobacteria bacterium RIFCSPLOWO2_02_FULL_52_10]